MRSVTPSASGEYAMKFDQREWVNDIAVGAISGAIGGAVMAMLVPNPPVPDATAAGGIVGLVTGMLIHPIKWLLDRRPPEDPEDKS
jgi:hypothetical protein